MIKSSARPQAAFGAALLAAFALVGCSTTSTPSPSAAPATNLHVAGVGGDGVAMPRVPTGGVMSFRTYMLCTDGAPATVTGVAPIDSTGSLSVVGWGVRPNPFQTGQPTQEASVTGSFPARFGFSADAPVTGKCATPVTAPPTEVVSELAISVDKPSDVTAAASSFAVTYESDGSVGTLNIPFSITLCQAGDANGICAQANTAP